MNFERDFDAELADFAAGAERISAIEAELAAFKAAIESADSALDAALEVGDLYAANRASDAFDQAIAAYTALYNLAETLTLGALGERNDC
jgi:hypothetical protein